MRSACPWQIHNKPLYNQGTVFGGGGNSSGGSQTTQQSSSSAPPAFIQPYLQKGITDLTKLYDANPNAPGYYPKSTVAEFSPTTQNALSALVGRATGGSPVTQSAQRLNADTTGGKYLDLQSNPYFQNALSAGFEPGTRNFTHNILPGVTSQFAASGRGNSGAHESAIMDATNDLTRNQANAGATAGAATYANERGLQGQAAALAPTLANQDYVDINQLGSAGQTTDNQTQTKIDADIARYNYGNNSQWDYINRYLASLNGGYPGGENVGTSTTTSSRSGGGDGLSSIFGAGLGAAGLGLQAFAAFSDERLKDDFGVIGKTHDGQPLHLFKYKGANMPTVGLMAQEVEKIRPEAVSEHASGYKIVNYGKALGLF